MVCGCVIPRSIQPIPSTITLCNTICLRTSSPLGHCEQCHPDWQEISAWVIYRRDRKKAGWCANVIECRLKVNYPGWCCLPRDRLYSNTAMQASTRFITFYFCPLKNIWEKGLRYWINPCCCAYSTSKQTLISSFDAGFVTLWRPLLESH
jgi:hypothetical protein